MLETRRCTVNNNKKTAFQIPPIDTVSKKVQKSGECTMEDDCGKVSVRNVPGE